MTDDERATLVAEKSDLQRKLAARQRVGLGYTANCDAIKARIAQITEELIPVE